MILFSIFVNLVISTDFQTTWNKMQVGMRLVDEAFPPLATGEAERTPFGTFLVNSADHWTVSNNVIVALAKSSDQNSWPLVMKFINNCMARENLAEEFAFMYALNGTGIAPNVYGVSNYVLVNNPPRYMASSIAVLKNAKACAWSHVGFIVEERIGRTVYEIFKAFNRKASFVHIRNTLIMGLEAMRQIERLHALGIVHGDIHANNVGYLNNLHSDEKLVLIDFGKSKYFPAEDGSDQWMPIDPQLNPTFLSPWHLNGERIGRRDDVFRIVEMIIDCLSASYGQILYNLATNTRRLLVFKASLKFPILSYRGAILAPEVSMYLTNNLGPLVMGMKHPDNVPDYVAIMATIQTALEMLEKLEHPETNVESHETRNTLPSLTASIISRVTSSFPKMFTRLPPI